MAFVSVLVALALVFSRARVSFARLHVGHLAIVWVLGLALILAAVAIAPDIGDGLFRDSIVIDAVCGAAFAVGVAVVLFPLATSWVWFGARQARSQVTQ